MFWSLSHTPCLELYRRHDESMQGQDVEVITIIEGAFWDEMRVTVSKGAISEIPAFYLLEA